MVLLLMHVYAGFTVFCPKGFRRTDCAARRRLASEARQYHASGLVPGRTFATGIAGTKDGSTREAAVDVLRQLARLQEQKAKNHFQKTSSIFLLNKRIIKIRGLLGFAFALFAP